MQPIALLLSGCLLLHTLSAIRDCVIVGFKKQRICIKCCFKFGKTESETEEILKTTSVNIMWENMTLFSGFSTEAWENFG